MIRSLFGFSALFAMGCAPDGGSLREPGVDRPTFSDAGTLLGAPPTLAESSESGLPSAKGLGLPTDEPVFVSVDAYLGYQPNHDVPVDGFVGFLKPFSFNDEPEPSRVVFYFASASQPLCSVSLGVHNSAPDNVNDASTDRWRVGNQLYTGLYVFTTDILEESTCDTSNRDAWLDWFDAWGVLGFGFSGFSSDGTPSSTVASVLTHGDRIETSERTGEAYALDEAGKVGELLPPGADEGWDYSLPTLFISYGRDWMPLETE